MGDVLVRWIVPLPATEEVSLLDREHSIVYTLHNAEGNILESLLFVNEGLKVDNGFTWGQRKKGWS